MSAHRNRSLPAPLLAVLLVVALLAVACGGGDDDDTTTGADDATDATDATDGDTATGDSTTTTLRPAADGGTDESTDGDGTVDGSGDGGGSDDGPPAGDGGDADDDGTDGGDADDDGADPGPTTTTTYELADRAFTEDSAVSTVGLDEIIFGMTPDEAAVAAATTWEGLPDPPYPDCVAVTPSNGPEGVTFYVIRNTVERVDITNPEIRTRSGYGVGTTLGELEDGLGDSLETVSDGEDGVTATFVPTDETDADFRIVFEVELGEVVSFRSGRALYIDFAGGDCDTYDPPPLPVDDDESEDGTDED